MSQARTLWDEGEQRGRSVVVLGFGLALVSAVLDVGWSGDVGWLFGAGFVAASVAAALLVRPADFFTVALFPPPAMLGVFVLLAAGRPDTIAQPDDGVVQAVVSGLATNAGWLLLGYVLCLVCLGIRLRRITPRSGRDRPTRGVRPRERPPTSR